MKEQTLSMCEKSQVSICQGCSILTAALFPLISEKCLWLTFSQDESLLQSEKSHSESQIFSELKKSHDHTELSTFNLIKKIFYDRRRNNVNHIRISSNWPFWKWDVMPQLCLGRKHVVENVANKLHNSVWERLFLSIFFSALCVG